MKRTMIFLPEGVHKQLRYLAVRNDTSLASLVREAVVEYYAQELEDVKVAEKRLAFYKPGTGIPSRIHHKGKS